MPKHPRLMKRGNTYWHRASIPADIRSMYPKTEETFSLGTKEPQEALIRLRRAATEVDQRFAVIGVSTHFLAAPRLPGSQRPILL